MAMNYRTILERWPVATIGLTYFSYFVLQSTMDHTFRAFDQQEFNPGWVLFLIFGGWGFYSMFHIVFYLIRTFK